MGLVAWHKGRMNDNMNKVRARHGWLSITNRGVGIWEVGIMRGPPTSISSSILAPSLMVSGSNCSGA